MELESSRESFTRNYVAVNRDLLAQPVKGCCPNAVVVVSIEVHQTLSTGSNSRYMSIGLRHIVRAAYSPFGCFKGPREGCGRSKSSLQLQDVPPFVYLFTPKTLGLRLKN